MSTESPFYLYYIKGGKKQSKNIGGNIAGMLMAGVKKRMNHETARGYDEPLAVVNILPVIHQ
jgi:hypothetical protein